MCIKDVVNVEAFVWTVARNTLANYYRDNNRFKMNVSIEDNELDIYSDDKVILDQMIEKEDFHRIRREIAYLSKTRRQILIMYYYEEKKQKEIAEILNIPVGTVKWHLGVAKDELKKGMVKMRNINDLKFNPIRFVKVGFSGWVGSIGAPIKFLRSALSQNIVFCIKDSYRTIEEIADIMNVSPVFVESEIEFLEEYQIIIRDKDKYISNIVIEEAGDIEITKLCYSKISKEISSRLYDEIVANNYQNNPDILGPKDDNFRMWVLMMYLLGSADSNFIEKSITFDQAATIRADGGCNIIVACVDSENAKEMNAITEGHCGPCWNENDNIILWLTDGKWSDKRVTEFYGGANIQRDLKLIERFIKGESFSIDEYTFMLEKGYIVKNNGAYELGIVVIKSEELKEKLLSLASKIKNEVIANNMDLIMKYQRQLSSDNMPKNVRIQQDFLNQYIFTSDGLLLVFAAQALIDSERLSVVSDTQKKAVGQIVIVKNV